MKRMKVFKTLISTKTQQQKISKFKFNHAVECTINNYDIKSASDDLETDGKSKIYY